MKNFEQIDGSRLLNFLSLTCKEYVLRQFAVLKTVCLNETENDFFLRTKMRLEHTHTQFKCFKGVLELNTTFAFELFDI